MEGLNETVFNVSTPKISQQFNLSPAGVSWVMTIFLVFFGIGSVIYGKLSDIFSLKRLLMIGMTIYVISSILGFLFQGHYGWVVVFRGLQGVGASALPALIFVMVARYYPADHRGKIFGLITSFVSISIGLGPVLGGFVSQSLHWSYLFLIPVLIIPSIPFLLKLLPEEAKQSGRVDILGAVLVATTVGLLVVSLNYPEPLYLAAFVFSLVLTFWRMLKAKDPFIQPSLFANKPFRGSVFVGFLLFSIVIGTFFLFPLLLHGTFGLETGQIGLLLFPGAISGVVVGPFAGRLADRRGNTFVVTLGLSLVILSIGTLALTFSLSPYLVGGMLLMTNVGFILFQTAMMNSVSQTLSNQETGVGMGFFNLVSIISGAVGTAVVGKFLESGTSGAYGLVLGLFALIVLLGGLMYLWTFRNQNTVASP